MYSPFNLLGNLIFIPFALALLALKGIALWKAAQKHQREWFIAMLIFQTFGILEVIYLLIYQKDADPKYRNWFKKTDSAVKKEIVKDIEPKSEKAN